MHFEKLALKGVYLVEVEPLADERGFFARTFCKEEFAMRGLVAEFSQASISFNDRRGTVRGLHFSVGPNAETKLVRCTAGAVYDVVLDLRPASTTFLDAIGIELSAANRRAIYIPIGLAHGFQTLKDQTEVLYLIDMPYVTSSARGIRWNDPVVKIDWPEPITVISERDREFPDWEP